MSQVSTQMQRDPYRLLPTAKRVRARLGGVYVADSRDAKILHVGTHPRTYVFPKSDVRQDLIVGTQAVHDDAVFGKVRDGSLQINGRTVENAVRFFPSPSGEPALADHIAVDWDSMDSWYEEDEEVFVHPRDPHHRVDVLRSRRHVIVEVDGTVVAESHRPILVFETGLPVRTYFAHSDVRLDLLRPSDTVTGCPYKGFADHHAVQANGTVHPDLVWRYKAPFEGAHKVAGLFAFYDERVDVTVDGTPQERPDTPWKR